MRRKSPKLLFGGSTRSGHDETQPDRQRYLCRMCNRAFDDLTGTVFAGHHQPLSVWMHCLYFMGLNLSNRQIAAELEIHENSIQEMTTTLRNGIVAQEPNAMLEHKTACHDGLSGEKGGEYARDEDGDGHHEIHVNTMEGCWSLLRSRLRPHRGISQERLPAYVGFFQFVHNARLRGNSLLRSLVEALVCINPVQG